MDTKPPILMRFTSEELAVLFEQLAGQATPLDYQDLLPRYSEEQRKLAMEVARRSLVARQLIQPDDAGGFKLHPLAQAAVVGMVRQEPSIVVFRQRNAEDLKVSEFHTLPEGTYLSHTEPSEDVHEFAIFADAASYRQAILDGLALATEGKLTCPPGQLTQEVLERSLALAQGGNSQGALEALSRSPLPKPTARQLAASLSQPHEFKTIVALGTPSDTISQGTVLSFLHAPNGLWRLDSPADSQTDGLVSVQPMSEAVARQAVRKFLTLP